MTGNETLILIGVLAVAGVVSFAVWRYSRIRVRVRVPLGEGQLEGENADPEARSRRQVATRIGGEVVNSSVDTVGGSIGAIHRTPPHEEDADVTTDVKGAVRGSNVDTVGGDKT